MADVKPDSITHEPDAKLKHPTPEVKISDFEKKEGKYDNDETVEKLKIPKDCYVRLMKT